MRVIDFMPPGTPESCVVRIVECLDGHVDMRTELAIRFDYGVTIPWVSRRDTRTLTAVAGPHLLTFRTPARCGARTCIRWRSLPCARARRCPSCWPMAQSFQPVPLSIDAFIALEETERYWQQLDGPSAR